MNRTSTCTGCGADLKWAYTEKGRRMPLDPEHIRPYQPMFDGDQERWLAHWVSCEQRELFRKEHRER